MTTDTIELPEELATINSVLDAMILKHQVRKLLEPAKGKSTTVAAA